MIRIVAITLLIIPGIFAAFGIKLMRDALFMQIYPLLFNAGLQFVIGLILFILGVGFIGGFVVHRDRKKNLVTRPKRRNRQ